MSNNYLGEKIKLMRFVLTMHAKQFFSLINSTVDGIQQQEQIQGLIVIRIVDSNWWLVRSLCSNHACLAIAKSIYNQFKYLVDFAFIYWAACPCAC